MALVLFLEEGDLALSVDDTNLQSSIRMRLPSGPVAWLLSQLIERKDFFIDLGFSESWEGNW